MISDLLIPLQYDYMLRAIWVSTLIGGVCGFLSSFVTMKGWSLMGDALSHAVVPGVALAYLFGLPFALGAFVAGLLAAGTMAFVKTQSRLREDATMGIVFTTYFALGLLLISIFPAGVDRKTIIFGNILGISDSDILQVVAISVVALVVLGLKWRDLMLFCFDPNQARTLGLPVRRLHLLLLALLSAVTVAALQAVGAVLVVAMLITPGATAFLLTDRFGRMLWISSLLGAVTSMTGAYSSYYVNGSTGGCIVTLQTLVFLVAFIFAPKHGMLAAKRRARQTAQLDGPV
ncbi:metal ABC transporter permease [Luteolibacter flavescens]|uniref:Metal ABC transporter permease n=1 Tax=Luteolibacter flavescens TaxID=1859460 RepID=A0ABT3FIU9_9BACT|nr:metal ABC transporter permease [Luteolibacter flavescens]MCW1883497.1 metal ABC transporter permease [Luteolibacter flavescens]